MRRLFVELYLDEDVSVLVAELLRSHGFDVLTAREAGQLGKSDEEQLAYALSQSRALVSHNRSDFEALAQQYFAAVVPLPGVPGTWCQRAPRWSVRLIQVES